MKKLFIPFALLISTMFIGTKAKSQSNDKSSIEKLILSYRDALNASDANKVVALYTADGVLLANAAPSAESATAIKGTYQYVFDNYKYSLEFTIVEIVVEGKYAFARSTSKGSFVIKSTGQSVPDENRELFVFEKVKGQWKIARYMYNKTSN